MSLPQPDRGSTSSTPPGTPRWVKVSGIVAIVLILLVIILAFVIGGNHGPGRHLPTGHIGSYPSSIAHGVQLL